MFVIRFKLFDCVCINICVHNKLQKKVEKKKMNELEMKYSPFFDHN